ncbi:hypothetical protein HPULCUR_009174 [Helicostylum pulchrum]|uniref:3'-5' exonuclease n=1 Tax=Helicostylum pulchrum TaxID=562976 RepID=A0ABP9Y9R8_9FUNG
MFGSRPSNKNGGISKKKPGPKVGSKRDPRANRPGPKRLMDQPNLQQQRLDQMTLFQSSSSSSSILSLCDNVTQDAEDNVPSVATSNVNDDNSVELNITEESTTNVTFDNIFLDNNLSQATIENEDAEEGTESDEEDLQNFNNVRDNLVEDPIVQEYTEDEFEAVDEEAGGSTCEDSFVSKYLASIQNRLKGGVMPLDCFYLMSMNYRCTRAVCRTTFSGCDQDIVKQLNPGHQRAFPAILTHKSGISKDLCNVMRPLFQHGVGPHRLSKVIRILHTQRFDELQFVYYNGINDFKPNVASQLLNGAESQTFDQFSNFSDRMKYNGYTPSSNYLSYVYSSLVAEYRIFIDQHTSQLDGIILKLDHSFKIIKRMGKFNDVSTFNGLFTVLNEYGEIRMQLLVPAKGHSCLIPSFNNMMNSYRKYNLDMPQVAYTDNVTGDRKFLEEVIPSLTENVLHVAPSQAELIDRNSPYNRFPVAIIPSGVNVTVFSTKDDINAACDTILEMVRDNNSELCVGFDIEWTPSFVYPIGVRARLTGSPIPVALVQIYFDTSIYLFRTFSFSATTFPEKLRDIIECKRIMKVGRQIGGDLTKFAQYGIINCPNQLDIGTLCYDKEVATRRNYSLQRICGEVLMLNLLKPADVRKSNWEMDTLSPEHVQYAAVDAYISLRVYKKLKDLETVKKPVTSRTPPGTFVASYASSADKVFPAALGYLRDILRIFRGKNECLIGMEVVKVLIPGTLLNRYKNGLSLDDFGQPKFIISVDRTHIFTASESNYLSSFVNAISSPIENQLDSTSHHEINSAESYTVPSRVLKDAFHLLDLIKVSLRHGLSKDFIRQFRDALFVVDTEDKQKVENYLASIGTDWNTRLVSDPEFIFSRVRRYIPPPEELYPNVKLVFDKYANDLCSRTGLPLFDNEAAATSQRILEEIRQGNVSDVVGGPSLYTEIGEDKNGLMKYRCSRGTSSVEDSVHFNIIRKFASYNAGPRLTDAILSDYRLYHNISMGSITRHSRFHNWHSSPWLSEAINTLRIKLGHNPVDNYFGNRIGNTFSYSRTNETFGITKIPLEISRKYDMLPLDYSECNFPAVIPLTQKRVFDLCILPVVKLPYLNYSGKQFLYRFLAYFQGTSFAVTAVHTKEEMELFDELLVTEHDLIFGSSQLPTFSIFAKLWSVYCLENSNIFYKTEDHLNAYFNIKEGRARYGNTVLLNTEISQSVRSVTQNPARCTNCLITPAVTRPVPPTSEVIISMFSETPNATSNEGYRAIVPAYSVATTSNYTARFLAPNGPTSAVLTPLKKRRRNICKLCNQNDCGGRSKRILCVNKCGKCQSNECPGRYVVGRNAANIPCESTS